MSTAAAAALCFIGGVVYAREFISRELTAVLLAVGVLILVLYIVITAKGGTFLVCVPVCMVFFVLGTTVMSLADMKTEAAFTLAGTEASVRGTVMDIPVKEGENYKYIIEPLEISPGNIEDIPGKLRLTTPVKLSVGSVVVCTGELKEFDPRLNETGFDAKLYYQTKDVYLRLYDEAPLLYSAESGRFSLFVVINKLREEMAELIDSYFDGDTAAVLRAVMLGDKSCFSEDLDSALLHSGLRRFLYPSFLHITMMTAAVGFFLGFLPKKYRSAAMFLLLICYGAVNSSRPVSLKAAVAAGSAIAAGKFRGRADATDTAAVVVIAIGVFDPFMLYDAGLIISLFNSVLISFFFRPIYNKFKCIHSKNVRRLLAMWVINCGLLLPVMAYFGGFAGIYSIWISVIMLPAVAILLLVSAAILCIAAALPNFSFALYLPWGISRGIQGLVYITDKLPFTGAYLPQTPAVILSAYIFAVAAVKCRLIKAERMKKVLTILSLGCMTVFAGGQVCRIGNFEITFVNVGQGDGTLLQTPFRETFIMDGGGGAYYSDYNIGREIFVPYLQSRGVYVVEAAFVSHFDRDHAEGIEEAIRTLCVKTLYMPSYPEQCEWKERLTRAAEENGTQVVEIGERTELDFSGSLTAELIPPEKGAASTNDASMVVRWEFAGVGALFTGDISTERMKELISEGLIDESEILKVPHHGSKYSVYHPFAETVRPEYAIFSLGADNTYGFPTEEAVASYASVGADILRTDINGDIHINVRPDGEYSVRSYK